MNMGENKEKTDDSTSVRVALRIRPQLAKERIDMCQVCTSVTPGENQLFMGKDKAFTFDYVFDIDTQQNTVYDNCAKQLIEGTFEGYNATIVAYGQTGSGKTYTMGTGFEVENTDSNVVGIIPRAVEHLFRGIELRRNEATEKGEPPPDFKVNAQFMELYNEDIHDLLDTTRNVADKGKKSHIKVHEDAGGGIYCVGVTTRPVHSLQETMQCLHVGALSRATASTNMNAQSSRSHAIFTLHIRQTRMITEEITQEDEKETDTTEVVNEFETLTAKFHFVDLAGSERLKRTGATGDRAKEGISINCGLLALGNVISALGDITKKGCHVPYRDSKLTRLLQDSLGGNSRTVMIACVSPSDRDFMETLNTLKYANRARNIQNKVTVNQDKTSKQISMLRAELMTLQAELAEYKAGKKLVGEDGVETINDMFHENTMLQTENNNLRQRIKALQETIEQLRAKNVELLAERDAMGIASLGGESANEEVQKLIQGYIKEIEELRSNLMEAEATSELLRHNQHAASRTPSRMTPAIPVNTTISYDNTLMDSETNDLLEIARREVLAEKKLLQKNRPKSRKKQESDKENEVSNNANHLNEDEPEEGFVEENGENEDDNEEDEEVEELENSDSDDEDNEDDDAENLHEDLANLTCDISIKQKLIEELEMSQKRLQAMKSQYEEKLGSLQSRIKATEAERDRVLSSLGDIESHSQEKVSKVKNEYEKKLNSIQNEVKKVQAAKKEHAKLLKNQSHYEKQLKTLQRDLSEMKKFKVKLMNQIKEETGKRRQIELLKNRETAQLKKEQRILEGQMQKLQSERKQKDIVLKRKVEEIESLKNRAQRPMSAKVAGRVGTYEKPPTKPYNVFTSQITRRRKKSDFSPKAAKNKWDSVERSVASIITKRQTVAHMERDMDRWLKERESKGKKIEKLIKKKQKSENEKPAEQIQAISDQIEQLRNDITFIQDNINDCQSNIMQMEESKQDFEQEPTNLFNQCSSLEESKYLLEHFLNLVISKGLQAAQRETENKELIAKLHQENVNSTLQRDMLQFLIINQTGIEIDESLVRDQVGDESDDDDSDEDEDDLSGHCSDHDNMSPIDRMLEVGCLTGSSTPHGTGAQPALLLAEMQKLKDGSTDSLRDSTGFLKSQIKARRQKTTPEDLLYAGGPTAGTGESVSIPTPLLPVPENPVDSKLDKKINGVGDSSSTMMPPKSLTLATRARTSRPPTTTDAGSVRLENGPSKPSPSPSPSLGGRKLLKNTEPSPVSRRKVTSHFTTTLQSPTQTQQQQPVLQNQQTASSNSQPAIAVTTSSNISINRHSSMSENVDATPPGSPSMSRRGGKTGNVFSRLTRHGTNPSSPHPSSADDSMPEDGPMSSTVDRESNTTDINHNRTSAGPITLKIQKRSVSDHSNSLSKDPRHVDCPNKSQTSPTTPTFRRKIFSGSSIERKNNPTPKSERKTTNNIDKKPGERRSLGSASIEKKSVSSAVDQSPFSRAASKSFRDSRTSSEKKNFVRTGSMRDRSRSTLSTAGSTGKILGNQPGSTTVTTYRRGTASPNPERHSITASGGTNRSSYNSLKSPGPIRKTFNRPPLVGTNSSSVTRSKSKERNKATAAYVSDSHTQSRKSANQVSKYDVPIGTTPPSSPKSSFRRSSSIGSDHSGGTGSLHGSGEFYRRYTPITRGVINPASGRHLKNTPLIHAFTAAGHSKAVLHIHATDDLMFSASKDKTAKIWDLGSGEEVLTLDGHPNNVNHVKFCEYTQTVITTCAYFMKIWDLREGNKCIRTITSAGQISDGSLSFDSISRQIACPPGEAYINDIAINSTGSALYSAAGNTVKIWDLRNFKAVGKLSGGHQAQIMVLAVDDTDTADGNICLVTGSKDHYIKVFDLMEDSVGVITPKFTLEPPHYDGIQSLCLMGDLLFSGSRDTCIKKWDLADQQLQQSINNAHKDWVKGLAFMPGGNCLVSGCRSGAVKLWHIDSCTQLGEMRAHNSQINHITTNNSMIFTASDDRGIHIWKPKGSLECSDASDGE